MELTDDQRDLIVLASHLRGGIKCQLTKDRVCGYLIRPELWFVKMNDAIRRTLSRVGVEVRSSYSSDEEISAILDITIGLDDLSPTPRGIENVRILNGQISQPRTHEEVMATIQAIEELLHMNA